MTTRETDELDRAGLHRDIDLILDNLQNARDDRHAIGYPTSTISGRGGGELTSVEAAAENAVYGPDQRRDRASEFLAEAKEARSTVIRVANLARRNWPTPATKGTQVGGVTIGQRGSTVETCGLCGLPAPSGTDQNGQPLVRRIDGQAFHNTAIPGVAGACYWQVWRQRRHNP
jgi:hypothetical protein